MCHCIITNHLTCNNNNMENVGPIQIFVPYVLFYEQLNIFNHYANMARYNIKYAVEFDYDETLNILKKSCTIMMNEHKSIKNNCDISTLGFQKDINGNFIFSEGTRKNIRILQYEAIRRLLVISYEKYNNISSQIKDIILANRQWNLKKSCPNLQNDEIDLAISNNIDADVIQKIAIEEDINLLQMVNNIESRSIRLMELSKTVDDISELTLYCSQIVDTQQVHIDIITDHIHSTKKYTEKGLECIIYAEKKQNSSRKCMCVLL